MLTGERTALNLLGRLCGIATLTARYVELVEGTGATILDTRKTTPGPARAREVRRPLRRRDQPPRSVSYDAILLKENHLRLAGGISRLAVARRCATAPPVEVEAETLARGRARR